MTSTRGQPTLGTNTLHSLVKLDPGHTNGPSQWDKRPPVYLNVIWSDFITQFFVIRTANLRTPNLKSVASRAPQPHTQVLLASHLTVATSSEGKMNEADVVLTEAWLIFSAPWLQTTLSLMLHCRRRLTQLCLDDLAGWFVHLRCQGVLICNDSVTNVGC